MARDLGRADPTLQVRSGEVRAHRGWNPGRRPLFTATSRCRSTPDLFSRFPEKQRRNAQNSTQLGRALRELGIGSILAYSPQAKGRIERSFLTAQDRLVKHLRLAKVATMEGANAFLEKEYWPEWNAHFARPVADFPNQHRALSPQLDLAAVLCHVEERVIGNDYTFSFAGRRYQIE